jgi:hypothetical protein
MRNNLTSKIVVASGTIHIYIVRQNHCRSYSLMSNPVLGPTELKIPILHFLVYLSNWKELHSEMSRVLQILAQLILEGIPVWKKTNCIVFSCNMSSKV